MTNWQSKTIQVYDDHADGLSEYFATIGVRKVYVDLAFKLIGNKEHAKVVEIGCGDGRDAQAILSRTDSYIGFDPSRGMIELARKKLPKASFEITDALSFKYPPDIDIVFAFASLLHINKEALAEVIKKVAASLRTDGIFYISLKESDHYEEKIKEDQFGRRMFYFYSVEDIAAAASDHFKVVAEIHETIGKTKWFDLALRRK